ncbi:murein biosynthesis integral membrane protein MurJ [Flexivirga caeni]|uniref:Murein biosynthesis integral membrane protein MurJ n=1 Tax=Flexivirga caeni TaxID=2294115 RepID=A0A3M9M231_9MICO|nr:murein biosynthesis integral membrane protein MurJ [Flexivirga caeni]RNI19641.1 murein biosynthesis integral membrane protein MurJ [Flexivirga caeni]
MTDESRPTLGQLYAESEPHPVVPSSPESGASLGSLYSAWIGEDSGYLPLPDPDVVQARKDAIARGEDPDSATGTAAMPVQAPPPEGGIGRASAIMAAGTLVSRALGFLRSILITALILGVAGNVWNTANTLPNQIYILLAGGVINAVLVPQITRALKDPDGGQAYTDRLLTLAMSILLGATVVFMAAAPVIFKLGYLSAGGEAWKLGIIFTLLCMPQLFFYGLYTLLGEVLNARSSFGPLMWSPVLANIFAIAGLIWLLVQYPSHPITDPGAWTTPMVLVLAGSTTLGIAAQAIVLVIPLRRSGYTWHPNFSFRGVGLRSTSTVAGWAFASVITQQIGLYLVTSNILNGVPSANIAQSDAFLFFMLPHSLVTLSLITVLFTRMSRAAHEGRTKAVTQDSELSLRLSSVATIPSTVGMLVLAAPLCGVFYLPIASAVERQSIALLIGLVPFTVCVVVQRAFFAYEDARTPFFMQVWCTVITTVLALPCLLLPQSWIGFGVSLAGSIAYFVEATIGYRALKAKRLPQLRMVGVAHTWARLAVASVLALIAAFVVRFLLSEAVGTSSRSANLVILLPTVFVFGAVYVAVARRLHVKEIEELVGAVSSRLGGVRRLLAR